MRIEVHRVQQVRSLCANVTETVPPIEITVENEQEFGHGCKHVQEERCLLAARRVRLCGSGGGAVAGLCGAVLDGAPRAEPTGRAKFQVAVTVCQRCHQGWQDGAGARESATRPALRPVMRAGPSGVRGEHEPAGVDTRADRETRPVSIAQAGEADRGNPGEAAELPVSRLARAPRSQRGRSDQNTITPRAFLPDSRSANACGASSIL